MATALLAGCTGGMGSLLLDRLNQEAAAKGGVFGQPLRHLILIDYFKDDASQKALRSKCHASVVKVDVLHWDASSDESTVALVATLERLLQHSVLNLVLVTTGIGFHGELKKMSTAESAAILTKLLKINAIGPAMLVQYCAKKMEEDKGRVSSQVQTGKVIAAAAKLVPTILIVSSFSGVVGLPHRAAYCSSKFALNGYVESLAAEFTSVRYVCVCPTSVSTGFRENWKKQLSTTESTQGVEVNAAQLTAEQCVEGIWSAVRSSSGGKPGVDFVILPKGKSAVAFYGVRLPFGIGGAVRQRVYRASSKM